jgi:hypothetical protein
MMTMIFSVWMGVCRVRASPLRSLGALSIFCISASITQAQSLTNAQIKQIEVIAQKIASQHNENSNAMLDDMTISSRAVAVDRNVRFEYVLRIKKGLPPAKIKEFSDEAQREVVPKSCSVNANNPVFDRGLSYSFLYKNTYGEKLAEFNVSKEICKLRK